MLALCLALIDEPSDKEKFTKIYNAYKDMMFGKAMSIVHNSAIAEEVVQESFLKIAKNISKISEPICSKTASFIVIIVRNTALDMIKSEHSNETETLNSDISDAVPDILDGILSADGYNKIISLVEELDNIYSDILMLKFVYGYDNDEISEMLCVPKRTVESRILRGKNLLKRKLEEEYGTEKIDK